MINLWDYVNSRKVKIIDIDGNIFEGSVVCVTDSEENETDEDDIAIQIDEYTIVGFYQSEIRSIENVK